MTSDHASWQAGDGAVSLEATPGERPIAAVLVVKNLAAAKTRLAASLDTALPGDPPLRELVLAMLLDTLTAVEQAGLSPVVVVSPDDEVLRVVSARGDHALRETVRRDSNLNHAYAQGAAWVRRHRPDTHHVMMVQADLPAADPRSIVEVIAQASSYVSALVADSAGTGTAILVRPVTDTGLPQFGPDSAEAHRRAGATELDPPRHRWQDLRTDVDTAGDLARALTLGVGAHTREIARTRASTHGPGNSTAAPRPADAS